MISAREYNRRIKQAVAVLKAAGAQRVAVDILANGDARVVEADAGEVDHEAERINRLMEDGAHA